MTSSSAIALVTIISIVVGTYQVYRAAKSTERQLYDIGLDHGHECIIRSPGLDFRRSDHYCHTHQCSRRHAVGTPRNTNHELLEVPRHPECSYDKRWTGPDRDFEDLVPRTLCSSRVGDVVPESIMI